MGQLNKVLEVPKESLLRFGAFEAEPHHDPSPPFLLILFPFFPVLILGGCGKLEQRERAAEITTSPTSCNESSKDPHHHSPAAINSDPLLPIPIGPHS